MKRKLLLSLGLMFVMLAHSQVIVNVTEPGTLRLTLMNEGYTLSDITDLTVKGKIDARDFTTMRDALTKLAILDIKDAEIEAYSGMESPMPGMPCPANTIPMLAFSNPILGGKTTLTSITVSQETIGMNAFMGCPKLTTINLLPGIKKIESSAFNLCTALTEVIIPNTVEDIGTGAFNTIHTITSFTFESPSKITTLRSGILNSRKLTAVTIPASVTTIEQDALIPFYGKISVEEENENYSSLDGILYNKDKSTLLVAPVTMASVNIPETVKVIAKQAFYKNDSLTAITLPSSVETIGYESFAYDTLLISVSFAENSKLKTIEGKAFNGCHRLETITIPASVEEIQNYALDQCKALSSLYVYHKQPLDITANALNVNKETCTLFVLDWRAMNAYRAHPIWGTFKNIVPIEENTPNEFYALSYGNTLLNISNNGRYLVGESGNGSFLWDLENTNSNQNDITYLNPGINTTTATAVTNDKVVLGTFPDPDYMRNGNPIVNIGIWRNDEWKGLGLGPMSIDDIDMSASNLPKGGGITEDAKLIVGRACPSGSYNSIPYSWEENEDGRYTELAWSDPVEGKPTIISDISADGKIACGWTTNQNGDRIPVIWTSPTEYKIIQANRGECTKISDNGKYIALSYNTNAAIYYVDTEEIYVIKKNAYASDVSDNGVVVGYYNLPNEVRKGFVWSQEMGFADLSNYISTYAKDIQLPEGINFNPDNRTLDNIAFISSDGTILGGWTAPMPLFNQAWVLKFNSPVTVSARPLNLEAKVSIPDRNKVTLTWSSPESTNGLVISGYKVFRDSEEIASVNAETFTHTDNNAPDGNVNYSVSTVYEGGKESLKTDEVTVYIYSTSERALPYIDNFDYEFLESNLWTATPRKGSLWYIDTRYSQGFRGLPCTYRSTGDGKEFSELLISRPFDATKADKVYLSYLYIITLHDNINIPDTIYTEIKDETNEGEWEIVNKIPMKQYSQEWQYVDKDISKVAAGKVFSVRFRATGTNNEAEIVYFMDNFQVRKTTGGEAPKALQAIKKDSEVYLTWQDPAGSYGLTYASSFYRPLTLGNVGKTIIGANKFEQEDLIPYIGMKITSISTFIPQQVADNVTYKLVIFENGTKVREQDVYYYESSKWNNFQFDTPFEIKPNTTLHLGIEASDYPDTLEPLTIDKTKTNYNAKGSLFTEDNGETWSNLEDHGFSNNWCMVANVKSTDNNEKEESENVWGYYVYKNGIRITDEIIESRNFTDKNPEEGGASYSVKAYYNNLGLSDFSEEATPVDPSGISNTQTNGFINIYPNPIIEGFRVDGIEDNSILTIIDLSGRELFRSKVNNGQYIPVKNLSKGMYIICITTDEGSVEMKVMKK